MMAMVAMLSAGTSVRAQAPSQDIVDTAVAAGSFTVVVAGGAAAGSSGPLPAISVAKTIA